MCIRGTSLSKETEILNFSCLQQLNIHCCSHHVSPHKCIDLAHLRHTPAKSPLLCSQEVWFLWAVQQGAPSSQDPTPSLLLCASSWVVLAGLSATAGPSTISTWQSLSHKACKTYTHSHKKHHCSHHGSLWPQLSVSHAPRATFRDSSPPYHAETRSV